MPKTHWGPHQTPKRTETPPDLTTFLLQCLTQLKSACSGPKFAKQSILSIIGPNPRPRGKIFPAVTPWPLFRPPNIQKTPPTRPIAISRVLREQRPTNQPTNQPTNKAAYRVACTQLKMTVLSWQGYLQVIVTQNVPNNPSFVLLGLIHVQVSRLPSPDPMGPH